VIVPDLPPAAVDGDRLVPWPEFRKLPDTVRVEVLGLMDAATAPDGTNIDLNALRDSIKVQQLPIYQELK
jgi:hypothetical protein